VIVAHGGMSSEIRPGMKRVRIIEMLRFTAFNSPLALSSM